ncbi:MAG: dephospho-CoA kinase [Christensenellales bacterium]
MLRIGITGGIASGKSAVDAYLAAQGVPVLDADQVAREVVAPGSPILAAIDRRFPGVVVDGRLDRRALGAIIFADPVARHDLERIEHPEILRRMGAFLDACAARGDKLAAIDAALLLESGGDALVDEVWVVHAEESVRVARLMAREGIDAAEAHRRIAAQMDEGERLARADRTIDNSGSLADTHGQLRGILAALASERK